MKLRIAIWAGAGALVVVFWTLYISATVPSSHGTMWTLAYSTCPIALARDFAQFLCCPSCERCDVCAGRRSCGTHATTFPTNPRGAFTLTGPQR
jgi:hypothetical protein